MKSVIVNILLILLSFPILSSKSINIILESDGIRIGLNNIDLVQMSLPGYQGKTLLFLNEIDNASAIVNTAGYALQEIRFLFAVPDADIMTSYISEYNTRYIGDLNLALFNEVKPGENDLPVVVKDKIVPEIKIVKIGEQRGVDIVQVLIRPFEYNTRNKELRVIDSLSVKINFNKDIYLNSSNPIGKPLAIFSALDNLTQLNGILSLNNSPGSKSAIRDIILENEDWYDNEIKYFKVSTKRDGIARLDISSLLNVWPGLQGKDFSGLHMLYKGESYPFAVKENGNGTIDPQDEIYFLGRRPEGDSTWFANYTDQSAFFLYYDENKSPLRFAEGPYTGDVSDTVGSVTINRHIELEKEYYHGKDIADFNTSKGEGWYWTEIDKVYNRVFSTGLFLSPSYDLLDSIKISAHLRVRDSVYPDGFNPVTPDYLFKYLINTDTVESRKITNKSIEVFERNYSPQQLFPGINTFGINLYKVEDDGLGSSYLDYIEISGKAIPSAYNNETCFSIDALQSSSKLIVPGYKSNQIIMMDTINSEWGVINGINGDYVNIGVKNEPNSYVGILLNDSSSVSFENGYHLMVIQDEIPQYTYYPLSETESLKQLIENLPAASIVAVAYNGEATVSGDMKSFFESVGSAQINSHTKGMVWACAFVKESQLVYEALDAGRISLSEFIRHDEGNYFEAGLSLQADRSYSFISQGEGTVEDAEISIVKSSDLKNRNNHAEAIILSHSNFLQDAERLRKHRDEFQGLDIMLVDVDDIYKEFNYGIKSIHAIKEFLGYALEEWQSGPSYLTIFGDANRDVRKVLKDSRNTDYIPTYGYPSSDYWYGVFGDDDLPDIIVGRVPVTNDVQAKAVVDKLILYDTIPDQPWMKDFLWLSGGDGQDQIDWFYERRWPYFFQLIYGAPICGDTVSVRKKSDDVVGELEAGRIKELINKGALWVAFLGHSSAEVFDLDGWHADRLNNYGKYSFFTTMSCNSGAFSNPYISSRNETYLLEPGKGFIGVTGATGTSTADTDYEILYKTLWNFNRKNMRLAGPLLYVGKLSIDFTSVWGNRALYQYQLLGDPLTRLRIDTIPDLYILKQEISVVSDNGNSFISEDDDYAVISGNVYNAGLAQEDSVRIKVTAKYENDPVGEEIVVFEGICSPVEFSFKIDVKDKPGLHKVIIHVDPDQMLIDQNYDNNSVELDINVFTSGIVELDPQPFWDIKAGKPSFRFVNPLQKEGEFEYEFVLTKLQDTLDESIAVSSEEDITISRAFVEWNPGIELEVNQSYWVRGRLRKLDGESKFSYWSWVPFLAKENIVTGEVYWELLTEDNFSHTEMSELSLEKKADSTIVTLGKKSLDFKILGIRGVPGEGVDEYCEIVFNNGNDIYVNTRWKRGFNIVVIPRYTGVGRYYHFDTYWKDLDSVHILNDLVSFLRDSVDDEDYLALATSGNAWHGPEQGPIPGFTDTISSALGLYGFSLRDLITPDASLALLGWKGAESGSIFEAVDSRGDSALIEGDIFIYDKQGYLVTPLIGPAQEWKNLELSGLFPEQGAETRLQVVGVSHGNTSRETLYDTNTVMSIDLSDVSIVKYPYLEIRVDMNKSDWKIDQYLSSIKCRFVPPPEFAILNDHSEDSESIMRGDDAEQVLEVQNISKRVGSGTADLNLKVTDFSGNLTLAEAYLIDPLEIDEIRNMEISIPTEIFNPENFIFFVIDDTLKYNELYRFNNTYTVLQYIFEDTTSPEIRLYVDDLEVENYAYVRIQPKFRIELWDNSRLKIKDSTLFRVRINGSIKSSVNTNEYVFTNDTGIDGLNALMSFIPVDSLEVTLYQDVPEPKGNLVIISAEDASGNKARLDMYLNVSQNGSILDNINYPNPFDLETMFEFTVKSPDDEGNAVISIFNSIGQMVRSLEVPLKVGKNYVLWDARDERGRSLPIGAYYYNINIHGGVFTEPVNGTCIIGR